MSMSLKIRRQHHCAEFTLRADTISQGANNWHSRQMLAADAGTAYAATVPRKKGKVSP